VVNWGICHRRLFGAESSLLLGAGVVQDMQQNNSTRSQSLDHSHVTCCYVLTPRPTSHPTPVCWQLHHKPRVHPLAHLP
jgi:hypothetical protein